MITENIILNAGKRDPDAFQRIYLEFKDFVWNIALKTTGNQTHAEDVTSEVFIRLFKNIRKFEFRSSFKTYLYRVTVNTTLNYLKKENRRKTKHLNEDFKELRDCPIKHEFDEKDLTDKLLSKLDINKRILIVLREIEGLSYDEIARTLNMNLGTVKTNIYRARDRLRKIYEEVKDEM